MDWCEGKEPNISTSCSWLIRTDLSCLIKSNRNWRILSQYFFCQGFRKELKVEDEDSLSLPVQLVIDRSPPTLPFPTTTTVPSENCGQLPRGLGAVLLF